MEQDEHSTQIGEGTGEVIFLFNHDAGHQVAHLAGIAGAMAQTAPARKVTIAYGSEVTRREVEKLLAPGQITALNWQSLALPGWLDMLSSGLNRLVPAHRLIRLYYHRKRLRAAAAIVSTERTCLTLKRYWSKRTGLRPYFVYVPHGSGDRNVAVHPALKDFDLSLVSGSKVRDQLVEAGVARWDQCRIIGYPKFDILRGRSRTKFFDNDLPTFVYNPHFDPFMSSWFDEGPSVLQWFYERPEQYNVIFAPHVMLFFKSIHISPEYKVTRRRPDIDPKYRNAPNILIDTDSARLFDMSYVISADAYIGDVSSQVYEFLYEPRPCFFIDVHSGNADEYDFWHNGPVVRNAAELGELLPDFAAIGARYRDAQIDRMARVADRSDPRTASVRGADAIADFLSDAGR